MMGIYLNVLSPSHVGATGIHKMTLSDFEESNHIWADVVSIVEERWKNGVLCIEHHAISSGGRKEVQEDETEGV